MDERITSHADYIAQNMEKSREWAAWRNASAEEIRQFALDLAAAVFATGYELTPSQAWGLSADEILAKAEAMKARKRRRAGVTALKARYGKAGAERIVSKSSGKRVHLQ